VRIKGGPELRARLAAVAKAKPELGRAWAEEAAHRISADAPSRTGSLRRSIHAGEKSGRAAVLGNFYGRILDQGTKAYPIKPRRAGTLVFQYKGQTIFAKQANRRRLRSRPFLTRGAQAALSAPSLAAAVVAVWSRKRASGRFTRTVI
jgi:hypothetical protein